MSPISISNDGNVNVVRVGRTTVLFSYDTTAAFTDGDGRQYINPAVVGRSKTTTKHLSQHGYYKDCGAIVCDTTRQFNAYLADALRHGAESALEDMVAASHA